MFYHITRIGTVENNVIENTTVAKNIEKKNNEIENKLELLQTDASTEKTTPNTRLVLKKTYEECGHTINEYVQISEDMVNKTQEEIEEEYSEWEVDEFSTTQLELIKEVEGVCNQHYMLRPKDGVVAIYKMDQHGNETLQETTAIAIEYLTEEDLEQLEEGVRVYGEENLNAMIEDFE